MSYAQILCTMWAALLTRHWTLDRWRGPLCRAWATSQWKRPRLINVARSSLGGLLLTKSQASTTSHSTSECRSSRGAITLRWSIPQKGLVNPRFSLDLRCILHYGMQSSMQDLNAMWKVFLLLTHLHPASAYEWHAQTSSPLSLLHPTFKPQDSGKMKVNMHERCLSNDHLMMSHNDRSSSPPVSGRSQSY